jgi:beta-glucanase (GH16 family)
MVGGDRECVLSSRDWRDRVSVRPRLVATIVLSSAFICGCGGGASAATGTTAPAATPAATPTFSTTGAQNGAVTVSVGSATPGSKIYYTMDGSTPTTSSQIFQAPMLVSSDLTVKAIATASGYATSAVASQSFTPNIPSNTLVWSDEFSNTTGANAQPDAKVWTYDTGNSGFGNHELENYCAWGSSASPCSAANPNAYVDTMGILHIVARQPSTGVYTSARMKSQGLFGFQYGRVEARMKLPEGQGMWPAFWLLGNNITTVDWPACGELDVMEHIDGSNPPPYVGAPAPGYDWIAGSIHGAKLDGTMQYHPSGFSAADWHTYGMIWSKGRIEFYVDDPSNVYVTFSSSTQAGTWPFEDGPQFLLLNLAVGGDWPGNPDATTVFPSEIQVDYVRVYTN